MVVFLGIWYILELVIFTLAIDSFFWCYQLFLRYMASINTDENISIQKTN